MKTRRTNLALLFVLLPAGFQIAAGAEGNADKLYASYEKAKSEAQQALAEIEGGPEDEGAKKRSKKKRRPDEKEADLIRKAEILGGLRNHGTLVLQRTKADKANPLRKKIEAEVAEYGKQVEDIAEKGHMIFCLPMETAWQPLPGSGFVATLEMFVVGENWDEKSFHQFMNYKRVYAQTHAPGTSLVQRLAQKDGEATERHLTVDGEYVIAAYLRSASAQKVKLKVDLMKDDEILAAYLNAEQQKSFKPGKASSLELREGINLITLRLANRKPPAFSVQLQVKGDGLEVIK